MAATRRHDIDWLRVLATYLLFAFHTAKVFDVRPFYHVKNGELSEGLGYFTGFVHQWHMPLFFLLAGWSAAGSIRLRGAGSFVRERASRLLVPLAFGLVAFGPVLRWFELRTGQFYTTTGRHLPADPDIGFLTFLPRYFAFENLTWAHLWFLAYLFTFSVLYLPLVARLVRRAPAQWTAPPWITYLPIVPLALIQVTLRPYWPGFQNLVDDWANFAYYSLYFLLGAALAHLPLLERCVQREAGRAGAVALAAYAGLIITDARGWSTANLVLTAVAGWCTVVGVLGAAARWLDVSNAALRWLAESAFPVYVLHQLAVAGIAFWVIGSPLGIAAKLAIVLVGAVALTLATYQLLVRPFGPMRVLLGMKAAGGPARSGRAAPVHTALPADR